MDSDQQKIYGNRLLGEGLVITNFVSFSNCIFSSFKYSVSINEPFFSIISSQLTLKNVQFNNVNGINKLFDVGTTGKLIIESSSFNSIIGNSSMNSLGPIVNSYNSSVSIVNSVFQNNQISGSSDTIVKSQFSNIEISGSNFTNNGVFNGDFNGLFYSGSSSKITFSKCNIASQVPDNIGTVVSSQSGSSVSFDQCSFNVPKAKNTYAWWYPCIYKL